MTFPIGQTIYSHESNVGGADLRMILTDRWECVLGMVGKGSVEGARNFVARISEMHEAHPDADPTIVAVDLSELHSSPVRAQIIIGRWLLQNRHLVGRIGVFEGAPLEMKLARALMKMARMREVGFFESRDEAFAFLRMA